MKANVNSGSSHDREQETSHWDYRSSDASSVIASTRFPQQIALMLYMYIF